MRGQSRYRRLLGIVAALALIGTAACAGRRGNQSDGNPALIEALAAVQGRYHWREDLGRYEYSDKARLEELLAAERRDEIVLVLVECLDDNSPSQSALDANRVPIGIVCYEALTQLVYHEPIEPGGDVAAAWPGHLSPRASPAELRRAKAAWRKVVRDKSYVFL